MKRVLTPLAAACLLASASLPLQASPYSTMVVFGDSLADAGQRADADGPAGATERFTNRTGPTYQPGSGESYGLNATQILNGKLGLGSMTGSTSPVNQALGLPDGDNWAVGGYRTDQILNSITGVGGSIVDSRSRDGYLVERGFRADPNALYYLTGGGNDFLQFQVTSTATAQASAGRLVDSVEALQQAGGKYIMVWLLPDVGLTPNFFGGGLQSTVSGLAQDFNTELVAQLAQVNAEVIPLNVPLMLSEVLADPARYGLLADRNALLSTCFDDCTNQNPVFGLNGTSPDPTKLLFNDSVHPTIAGQTLISDYAYSLLSAPWEISLLPEMAHGNLRSHQDQLRAQWQADWEAWQAVGQWRAFVNGGGQRLDYDIYESSADGNGYNLNFGGSYRLNEAWRLGLAAGFYEQSLEAGDADSDYELNSYIGTAFAQYQENRWWAELAASVGHLDYANLERKFELGTANRTEEGDTDGSLWAFSGRFGYDIAQPGSQWHLSPFISADYARVELDGYSEDGQRSTALTYDDQERTSKRLGIGLQGIIDLSAQTRLFAEVAQEREYEDDVSEVSMSQNALSGIEYTLEGYVPTDKTTRASLGVSHKLAEGLSLRGSYSYRNSDDDDQQGINVSLSWDL
ncbi:esterase EstP [Aquipseudomonas guryensis]|jgi:outer membrane lipase/esterase|uniref:Autotransporter domain-containing protein n=1 Tax=Aquipseudomonas guryensis TaxID=2759165 RepID=A0A7W4H295_9GAMM|nr:esterase EstP [Pseudomonas guryensis]MBB1518215.1 autotransporter domain-containing protein [Pseudomonas guryensis]